MALKWVNWVQRGVLTGVEVLALCLQSTVPPCLQVAKPGYSGAAVEGCVCTSVEH